MRTKEDTEYFTNVAYWKQIYRFTEAKESLKRDPSTVKLRFCYRCGKNKRDMARHHTGSDYFFAKLLPHIYASQYIAFHEEDVEWLCKKCHELAHRKYRTTIKEFWEVVNSSRYGGTVTRDVCDVYRDRLRAIFYKWAKKDIHKKDKKGTHKNVRSKG